MNSIFKFQDGSPSISGRVEFIHSKNSSSGAFDINEVITVDIVLPRKIAVISSFLEIFSDTDSSLIIRCDGVWIDCSNGFDRFRYTASVNSLRCGLYFCRPVFIIGESVYFGEYSSCGNIKIKDLAQPSVQLTVYSCKYSKPSKLSGGIIYHVFVDRFNRGGPSVADKTDVLIPGEWEMIPEYPEYPGAPMKNNTFYGGTLWGIIDKLDYISSLGVNAIYLSPIFESASNHRYDTADYMKIDGMLGGEDALISLIKEVEKRNIRIILDGVFNHTGADSIYFNKYSRYDSLGAFQSKDSQYYSWYNFRHFPTDYECWWSIDILPRINPDIASLSDYFTGDEGVVDKYRSLGIYGFRLDVVDELSDSFVSKIRARLDKYGEAVLYGEVWEDGSNKIAYGVRKKYYQGDELDGVMNYPLRRGLIEYIAKKECADLRYALTDVFINAPDRISNYQMNILGTHDTERILTSLSGEDFSGLSNSELQRKRLSEEVYTAAIERLKAAYTVIATLPGIPTVFYGDEAGVEGFSDPFNRMPYPWGRENRSLLEHYRKIGTLRRSSSIYKDGAFKLLYLDDDLLVFMRYNKSREYITVFNNSDKTYVIEFMNDCKSLISGKKGRDFELQPMSTDVFRTVKRTAKTKEDKLT